MGEELRRGEKALGSLPGSGQHGEFGERILGSVAVGLCWIRFDIPAEIRLGLEFFFTSGCCAVFPGMRAGT